MSSVNFKLVLQPQSTLSNEHSVDDPRRVVINHSIWQTLTHLRKKNHLDKSIHSEVFSFFQKRYGYAEAESFQIIWNKISDKVWSTKSDLTAGVIRRIDENFKKRLVYHGAGVAAPANQPNVDQVVQHLTRAILHGKNISFNLIEERTARAIFWEHDQVVMKHFQAELRVELKNLANHLPKNSQEEVVWRAFLGNIIALLPFAYPKTGDIFSIPVLENGECHMVDYHNEVILLHFHKFSSPMPALGLTPLNDSKAASILSCIGTTFPAGSGFAATLQADFTPGHSVGEFIYKRNRHLFDQWLADKKKVHVVGISLGGAMAFHILRHNHHITRVDAYSPPGLYEEDWNMGVGTTCDVNIYCQPGDTITRLGKWPSGGNIKIFTVYPHQKGLSTDPITAHARVYTGLKKITMLKEDPLEENKALDRSILTKMHKYFGPFLVFFPLTIAIISYHLARSVHKFSLKCLNIVRKAVKDP